MIARSEMNWQSFGVLRQELLRLRGRAWRVVFSTIFMILKFVLIPGLDGVHFSKESYIMLLV